MVPRRRRSAPGRPRRGAPAPRRALALVLLAAVLAVLGAALPAGAATGAASTAATPDDPDQPLQVSLDTLSPAVVPRQGPVQVTGSVTNRSDESWGNVNVYAFSSGSPITTADQLAEAVETDPATEVGARVVSTGSFVSVDDLEPGDSAGFTLRVPRSSLDIPEGEPGVYWFGVHALGTNADGRDGVADGRARTFLSQVTSREPQVPVSIVAPLRRPVVHAADGSIGRVASWVRDLQPGGRLRTLLDFAAAGSDRSLTWLVDPAVLDAVDRLAAGNPARSLSPTLPDPGDPGGTPPPSEGAGDDPGGSSGDPSGSPDESGGSDGASGGSGGSEAATSPTEKRASQLADVWSSRARSLLGDASVLALPFADLDVAGALVQQPGSYDRAVAFAAQTLDDAGIASTPAFAPPDGVADADTVTGLADGSTALLPERALEGGGDTASTVRSIAGHDVALLDEAATAGGPGPDDPTRTVQVRQRLLAETALRSLEGAETPTTVLLPTGWVPEDPRGFFLGLDDAPWVRLATLDAATAGLAEETGPEELAYPEEAAAAQVGARGFAAVRGLTAAGSRLEGVLTLNDTVGDEVARQALAAASYRARDQRQLWRRINQRSAGRINARLKRVRVEAPPSVTLSSEEGKFAASLVNGLGEPVTVRIEARTDGPVQISAPDEISLAPGESTSVLLTATTSRIGLNDVELVVTSPEGAPLGSAADLPIRSAQVSWIIWVVIAGGGGILVGAIVVRLVRRMRAGPGTERGRRESAGGVPATHPSGEPA